MPTRFRWPFSLRPDPVRVSGRRRAGLGRAGLGRPLLLVLLLTLPSLVLVGLLAARWAWQDTLEQALKEAQAQLDAGQLAAAESRARRALQTHPDSSRAALLASRAAAELGRYGQAYQYLQPLFQTARGAEASELHALAGRLQLQRRLATSAESHLLRVLEIEPENVPARRQLADLYTLQARLAEANEQRRRLVELRSFELLDLALLGDPQPVYRPALEEFAAHEPDSAHLLLARALRASSQNAPTALTLARRAVASDPQLAPAQALLGRLLLDGGQLEAFIDWQRSLPLSVQGAPEIWFTHGLWSLRREQPAAAARCFWECLRGDAYHSPAAYQLGLALAASGRPELAAPVERHGTSLRQLEELLRRVDEPGSEASDEVRQLAEILEGFGRLVEAGGWYQLALTRDPSSVWARAGWQRVRAQQQEKDAPRTAGPPAAERGKTHSQRPGTAPPQAPPPTRASQLASPLASQLDLAGWPLPRFEQPASQQRPVAGSGHIEFQDVAEQAGVNFSYYNSNDPTTSGRRMFEFTGGGVAVLDYDQDGWPDLYFTQGCPWPPRDGPPRDGQPGDGQRRYLDRLYRNRGDGTFEDVTLAAGLGDERFSQGVAAGDYDNDGFPDLFLANIGENRLYHNNGDGTFEDVGPAAGIAGPRWTSSCLIADLNGDSLPDLLEVNFLEGQDVFQCDTEGSDPSCSPSGFAGQQDRFFLNLGDGRFQEMTREAGFVSRDGKGLGVVAADFEGLGRLSVFVANDTAGNFFFRNRGQPGEPPAFEEQAVSSGLAFDRDGLPQACMGIAAGDANADGQLDLFVTNFYREANTLYVQQPGQLFFDRSRETRLWSLSRPLLGFGTQFLDVNLDGWQDLVVANGHVSDLTQQGIPFQMRPQLLLNERGQFSELRDAGNYFQRSLLGRGLARGDFDRDGRDDFAVSHLGDPVAVVLNRTAATGHFLAVQLSGTDSARDAIGAKVVVRLGQRDWTQQLTAGDGYFASNQRQLLFGLGTARQVDQLTVHWPSGRVQQLRDLAANQHLRLIEAEATAPPTLPAAGPPTATARPAGEHSPP